MKKYIVCLNFIFDNWKEASEFKKKALNNPEYKQKEFYVYNYEGEKDE